MTATIEYTITDGVDNVAGGYPMPRTWVDEASAEETMRGLCFHPKRHAGYFRVEKVKVTRTAHGTVLAVESV